MNIRALFEDFKNDTRAVSPVVATLVLIVVAITGASGIALLQGQFASEVAEDQNTKELGVAASTELMIAGSTTVQPVSELLAEAYMKAHSGTRVTVQGGGSGAGITSVGMDIVDIGAASRDVYDTEIEKYSDLDTYKIGGSAVVMIINPALATTFTEAHKAAINEFYLNGTGTLDTDGVTQAYDRTESSGTEDAFCKWIGNDTFLSTSVTGAIGNAGVLSAVAGDAGSIGFVDFGFADGNSDVVILRLIDGAVTYTADETNITAQLKLDGTETDTYPKELARPLNFITNGYPSTMEQGFIDFARLPESAIYFEKCGYFPIIEIA